MSRSRVVSAVKYLLISIFLVSLTACSVFEGQETTGEYIDDATVTAKIKKAFLVDPQVKSFQIGVETMDGVVQLSGFVDSAESEEHAVHVAEHVNGVKMVKDSLVIAPKPAS
jgi:osmotically-inducible protein OsmY